SNTKDDIATEQAQVKMFNSQLIDGLIMAPTYEEHAYLDTLRTGDYPVVFIDRKPTEAQGDCVLTEGARGAYEAARHLIGKGHERIGFITGSLGLTTSDERLAGFKQALSDIFRAWRGSREYFAGADRESRCGLQGSQASDRACHKRFFLNEEPTLVFKR
ncbi:substrate-binding domain-containing protein, partial [Paenibacillus sp. MCAF20]